MKKYKLALLAATALAPMMLALPAAAASKKAAPAAPSNAELLQRLDLLQQRLDRLEQENSALKQQGSDNAQKAQALDDKLEWRTQRLEKVENKVATIVKPAISPTIGDSKFNFKVRGVLDIDYATYDKKTGSYAFNDGTAFRRARLGAEGTAFKDLYWRFETEFAGNAVAIQDAYIQYNGIKNWAFTAGQHKAPFGLESNTSDNYNTFIERGISSNAFSTTLGERRIGLSARYARETYAVAVGVFGENESTSRANGGPGESYSFNGRATWTPVNADGKLLHIGAAGAFKDRPTTAASATATVSGTTVSVPAGAVLNAARFSDRPNSRVDGGLIADTGNINNVENVIYWGTEAVAGYGPVTVWGEYGKAHLNRGIGGDVNLSGYYVSGSWFLTGESRPFKDGAFDRLKPRNDFNIAKGGLGAWELAFRYDSFDFADPNNNNAARRANDGKSYTTGLNWYWNGNFKWMLNWVNFHANGTALGSNTAASNYISGNAYTVRAHVDW